MADDDKPPVFNYILSFILVGLAWGFTTPFIRRAARTHSPPPHPVLEDPAVQGSWVKSKLYGAFFAVIDLLRNPRYAVPLLLNLTGSVWFFLLIGQAGKSLSLLVGCALAARSAGAARPARHELLSHFMYVRVCANQLSAELSLTVPIVNTMAFLFTVVGEWYVEGKVISRGKTACTQLLPKYDMLICAQTPALGCSYLWWA